MLDAQTVWFGCANPNLDALAANQTLAFDKDQRIVELARRHPLHKLGGRVGAVEHPGRGPAVNRLVDLGAFPIHDPACAGYVAAVDGARAGLRSQGCAVLGGFVQPEAVARLNDEIGDRKHATHYSTQVMKVRL